MYEQYLALVGAKGIGLVDGISWQEVPLSSRDYKVVPEGKKTESQRRKLIVPIIRVRGLKGCHLTNCRKGRLRTLALLFHILSDESDLLLIEEPETCVHYGLLESIIEVIKIYGGKKQIIFSTHSEAVVDALKPESIFLVANKEKGTVVEAISTRLSKRKFQVLNKYLHSSGTLGEYWRHSGFER